MAKNITSNTRLIPSSFASTFCAALERTNRDIGKALMYASVNSAGVVSEFGATQGLLTFEQIEEKLKVIPRERKVEKRDYAIILIAARLGLRISDILNIRLKDIDWEHHCLNIIQPKTTHLNILPLSKEVGWAIIDYTQHARPTCQNEYLFVKMKYPFEKMEYFHNFTKYFVTEEVENTKKGIHNLRHSLAKNMLDQEIPLHTISSILGHNSLETTSNTYLSIDTNHLKGCSLEVEE